MLNAKSRDSIVFIAESGGFVFISIDSRKSGSDHLNPPSHPALNFAASFAWKLHPREGENAMGALASAVRIRHDLHSRLLDARARTDDIFRVVRDEAMYDRPIPERHRIIFYVGHVEAFDWNLLAQRAFGLQSFQRTFDHLFAFGIDPVDGGLPSDTPADWPSRAEVESYNRRLRDELDHAIEHALERPEEGHPQLITMLEVGIEHRLMHAETLAYILHRLPSNRKIGGPKIAAIKAHRTTSHLVDIPAGTAVLGLEHVQGDEFGWDNEFGAHEVAVKEFAIDNYNVTNHDFLRFMQARGYENRALWSYEAWEWKAKEGIAHPMFWVSEGNLGTYRPLFGEFRLPREGRVSPSHPAATPYPTWPSRKLPAETRGARPAYAP